MEWTNDDWETPDDVAKKMAGLIKGDDVLICEPCCGTGQIIKYLPLHTTELTCCEINSERSAKALEKTRYWNYKDTLYTSDFLGDIAYKLNWIGYFDVVITNPPFSKCVQFIERSLELLNPDNPNARLLFLLPVDWMSAKGRAEHWRRLDAHIHHVYLVEGRTDYLKNGVPASQLPKVCKHSGNVILHPINKKPVMMSGRQLSDAVFDIRQGKDGCVSYL
jgi:hypothetical protein